MVHFGSENFSVKNPIFWTSELHSRFLKVELRIFCKTLTRILGTPGHEGPIRAQFEGAEQESITNFSKFKPFRPKSKGRTKFYFFALHSGIFECI